MKKLLAIVLILTAPALLLGQETQPPPNRPQQSPPAKKPVRPVDPADVETLTGKASTPSTPSRAVPAPKLGHPLDPADVDVLTGKTDARWGTRPYTTPYVFVDLEVPPSRFGGTYFGRGTRPSFTPLIFGNSRSNNFAFLSGLPISRRPSFFFLSTPRWGTPVLTRPGAVVRRR